MIRASHSNQVFQKLRNFSVRQSPGPNSIHVVVLKPLAIELDLLLSDLVSSSLDEGPCPSEWKSAGKCLLFEGPQKVLVTTAPFYLHCRPGNGTFGVGTNMEFVKTGPVLNFLLIDDLRGCRGEWPSYGSYHRGIQQGLQ